jgi:phosphopantetheinyl transferase (holo-ACP synthase)
MSREISRKAFISDLYKDMLEKGYETLFSDEELRLYQRPEALRSLCARYLTKMALSEELSGEIQFNRVSILNDEQGAPFLSMGEDDQQRLFKDKGIRRILLSLSHSRNWAGVLIIIDYL